MKVQEIETPKGKRYILLDGEYKVVEPVKEYLKFLDNLGRSINTIKNYAYHLKTYFEYLNIIGIGYDEISCQEDKSALECLADFMGWLSNPQYFEDITNLSLQTRKDETVNIVMDTVLSFYDFLAKKGTIQGLDVYKEQRKNVFFKSFLFELVDKRKTIKKSLLKKKVTSIDIETEFVTREQYNLLAEKCNLKRDKILLAVMFEGGLRVGEALGIHIEDVEIWNNRINIVPRENLENDARVKNQAKGHILLPDYVMDLIQDYILEDLDGYDTNFLFVNLYGKNKGRALRVETVEKLFARLSKATGINVHPHMLRHGRGTELHESGWSEIAIQEDLRHKRSTSTKRYVHITEKRKREAVQKQYNHLNIKFGDDSKDE